ncbi:c-type cytochrome [Methyloferula stellata]|uniref:c-type cytochrome n=1 Tax=Methyloferula stellata TaxID=876270 RepID=UPI00047D7C41|nr:cytochrome c [Methyloferula stellata]
MREISMRARCAGILGATLLLSTGFILSANSQTPPAGGLNAARQAVDERKAVYKLIGASFKPIGNVLKGSTQYDAATIQKSIDRVVFLSGLLDEAFPENSNLGDPETKAKADIWTNHADFEKKEKNFQTHVLALQKVNETEKGATEAFKTAAAAVGQDCKACHDDYRLK